MCMCVLAYKSEDMCVCVKKNVCKNTSLSVYMYIRERVYEKNMCICVYVCCMFENICICVLWPITLREVCVREKGSVIYMCECV